MDGGSAASFLGDLSPFQVIVAAITATLAVYTLYRDVFGRPRLRLHVGPFAEVIGSGKNQDTARLRVVGTLSNAGPKLGVIQSMHAVAMDCDGSRHHYRWVGSLDPANARASIEQLSVPAPIAVLARGTQSFCVELLHDDGECGDNAWAMGPYEISLRATPARRRCDVTAAFRVTIGEVWEMVLVAGDVPRRWVPTDPPATWAPWLRRKLRGA